MVQINIPTVNKRDIFVGDGTISTFVLSHSNVFDVHVIISGIYLTENEDYTVSGNIVTFVETPLDGENINIVYRY